MTGDDDVGELAHRLKTPVAIIAGYAELLALRGDDETRTVATEQIAAAARRLNLEIDELLGLADGVATSPASGNDFHLRRRPARVVLIDDDVFVRRLLRTTLPAEGYEIAEASDGDMALAVAAMQQPDLALLDWRLPNLSGATVLRELKERYPQTAVVVLTVDGDQRSAAEELGADAFLTKPFSPLELLQTVERLLREPQHLA